MRALAALLILGATPVMAQEEAPLSLNEALTGATSVAAMGQGFVFVAKPERAYVCAVNMSPEFFAALVARDLEASRELRPEAVCLPAAVFKLMGSH